MSEEQNQGLASAATEAAEQEENKKQRRGRGKSQQAAEAQGDEPQEDEAQDGGESQADEAQDGGGETQDGDKQGSETAQSNPPADKVQDSSGDKKPPAKKTVPQVLYGKLITAANLRALAGVNKGVFPFTLALNSHDGSALPFPELSNQAAANLLPYAQNVAVTFANQNMLETFVLNVNRFAELWDWDEQRGVTVSPYQEKD